MSDTPHAVKVEVTIESVLASAICINNLVLKGSSEQHICLPNGEQLITTALGVAPSGLERHCLWLHTETGIQWKIVGNPNSNFLCLVPTRVSQEETQEILEPEDPYTPDPEPDFDDDIPF